MFGTHRKIFGALGRKNAARWLSTSEVIGTAEAHMATTYARPPVVIARGEGALVWDTDGKEYIDFTAGIAVTALGHSDPGVAKVIQDQAQKLVHCSNLYYNEWASQLSDELVKQTIADGGMPSASRVFLCNSGSEANEAAIKFARKKGLLASDKKTEFVAFKGGFHGRTYGALTATCNPKYQAPFAPMVPGFSYGDINSASSLDLIGPNTCGVIVEPIQGEGGINECSAEWLRALRAKCTEHDVVLIYDEIQCGLGRTGKLWAHSIIGEQAKPDIVTMAKALGNGIPIGATMVSEAVNDALQVGDHGTTYGGNPLASRVGLHVLKRLASPEIKQNVQDRSAQITERARKWVSEIDAVTEVRGKGLLLGVQLNQSPTEVISAAREKGLLVISCGVNTLRLVPALTISPESTEKGLDILEQALKTVE